MGGGGLRLHAAAGRDRRRSRSRSDSRPCSATSSRRCGARPASATCAFCARSARRSTRRTRRGSSAAASTSWRRRYAGRRATTRSASGRWTVVARLEFGRLERVELWTSSATHAVLPLLATDAGLRLQLGHRRGIARAPLRPLGRRPLAARVRLRAGARARAARARRARVLRGPDRGPRPRRSGAAASRWPPRPGPLRCRSTGRRSSSSGTTATATRCSRPTATTTAAPCTTCGRGATAAAPTARRGRAGSPGSTRATSSSSSAATGSRGGGLALLRPRHRAAGALVVRGPGVARRGAR